MKLGITGKPEQISIISIMLIVASFFLLGFFAVWYGQDATTRTQIVTGVLTSISAVTGYYYGSTVPKKNNNQNKSTDSDGTTD